MKGQGPKTNALSYQQVGDRSGVDITDYGSEVQIAFPSRGGPDKWRRFARTFVWVVVAFGCSIAGYFVFDFFIFAVLILLTAPVGVLLLLIQLAYIVSRPSTTQFDVLVVDAQGIRIRSENGNRRSEIEVDWKRIRSFDFHEPSPELRLPGALVFQTLDDNVMIALHRPIVREREILEIITGCRAKWASQFTSAELTEIELEQDRLTAGSAIEEDDLP